MAHLAAARLGSDGAPRPIPGTNNAGFEEGANGDDIDVFLCICDTGDKHPSDGDDAGPSDPAGERLNAGLVLIAYSPVLASLVACTTNPPKLMLIVLPCLCTLTRGRRYHWNRLRRLDHWVRNPARGSTGRSHVVFGACYDLIATSLRPHVALFGSQALRPSTNPTNHLFSLIVTS
jgi:hypothetical protein